MDSCVPGFKQRVFWISGGPGVGKTAISAVLSSRYLAACHFCASVGWTFLSVPVLTGLESPSYGNAQFRAAASQDASGAEVKRARESCRTPQRRVFETPHMDALARRGTTFLNAHIQSPLCNPSRTSLMLGLRPTTTGIYGLAPWFRDVEALRDRVTLPQHFAAHGYRTFTTGKVYHGGAGGPKRRLQEFDVWRPLGGIGIRPAEKLIPPTPMGNHPLMDWGVFPHDDEDKQDYIVASWSDHGYHLGKKGITGKNTLWDRPTRVPLIFAGPSVRPGARTNRPAELLDMYPTLIELCDLSARDDLEGLSLVPQLKDPDAPRERPAITSHNQGNHGIRSERYRYIRYADGSEELYDMKSDPNEWNTSTLGPRPRERPC